MLGFISVIIVSVFGLMLTTSYAWYAYENASTKFEVVTANENVNIFFQRGEYIHTESAIPIDVKNIDLYSDKYDFNILIDKRIVGNELVARISLVDIYIDGALMNVDEVLGSSPFRVDLFYQGVKVGETVTGDLFSKETYSFGDVVLADGMDNQFELRVYLLDNGGDQSYLMDKKFQAKIDINVVSRVASSFVSYDDADISISNIVIDGKNSKYLPSDGLYDMKAICDKNSSLSWDTLSKTLIYGKGSYFQDQCRLEFVRSNKKFYLKDMSVGSYVNYVGNEGCQGKRCQGENPNYIDDYSMGYCEDGGNHFIVSGWRIAYLNDNTAYLISAGSIDCLDKSKVSIKSLDDMAYTYCNKSYAYRGVCNDNSVWSLRNEDIVKMNSNNDLIDIGSNYWYQGLDDNVMAYDSISRLLGSDKKGNYGVRAVIRMDSQVMVVGGSGSYDDPYLIQK